MTSFKFSIPALLYTTLASLLFSMEIQAVSSPLTLTVMTLNAQNLFDETHDPGKQDFTYLPLQAKQSPDLKKKCLMIKNTTYRRECLELNWDQKAIEEKLTHLKEAIEQAYGPKGPDVLILTEIENITILKRLNQKLEKMGYQTLALEEGKDRRGIDNGILTRFKARGPAILHPPTKMMGPSRGILEVTLELRKDVMATIFAIHFPSQRSPTKVRKDAVRYLNQLGQKALDHSQLVIAAGDFNITGKESGELYRMDLSPYWQVSHLVGCHQCPGTYYYKRNKSWSFFDAILLRNGSQKPPMSCKIIPETITTHKEPLRGSDHLGIWATIQCDQKVLSH